MPYGDGSSIGSGQRPFGSGYGQRGTPTPPTTATDAPPAYDAEEGSGYTIPAILGTAALAGGAYLMHKPAMAGKIADTAMDVRDVSMLSGLAPLKSLLGNIGGSVYESIERGSLAPVREVLSSQTVKDAYQAFKRGPNYANAGPSSQVAKWNLPGRFMGALDEASQGALRRAGMSTEEAQRAMLQSPLTVTSKGGTLDDLGLNSRAGRYFVPFRRTPINQIGEGFKTFNANTLGKKAALATSIGSGAVSGTEFDDPKTIALGTAASGRYGVPYAMAAGVARYLSTGSQDKGQQVLSGISPVSDYSIQQGVLGPFAGTVPQPAAIGAYKYLRGVLGMD